MQIEKTFQKELTEDEEDREVWNKAKNLHHIGANKKAKTVIRVIIIIVREAGWGGSIGFAFVCGIIS